MKTNLKIYPIVVVILAMGLFVAPTSFTFARETEQDLQAIIAQLQQQIESLQSQIEQLKSDLSATKSELTEVKTELKFTRTLYRGVGGDDVMALQEFLKQSPDIYPEGLVTGYFGTFTEKAVQRLQEKENIVSGGMPSTTGYGQVGPKTREKLNELVINDTGSSEKTPPGLLTAPVVQDKIATTTATTTAEVKTQGPPSVTPSGTIPATPAEPAIPPLGSGGGRRSHTRNPRYSGYTSSTNPV